MSIEVSQAHSYKLSGQDRAWMQAQHVLQGQLIKKFVRGQFTEGLVESCGIIYLTLVTGLEMILSCLFF